MITSLLRRNQIQQQVKLDKIKAKLFQEEMREMQWTPDLSKTKKFNNKITKSMVDLRRQKSVLQHKEKLDYNKQTLKKVVQSKQEGCTFAPAINKKSQVLKRNFTTLIAPYSKAPSKQQENLFYL